MFLASYAPLFGILAYTNHATKWAFVLLTAAAAVGLAGLGLFMISKRDDRGPAIRVAHSRPQDGEVLAYIASYLVPFFSVDLSHRHSAIIFGGFLLVLGIVYINSSMLFVNPVLTLARYHSFEVEDEDGHVYAVLARRQDIPIKTVIYPSQITRYLRLEVRPVR